MKNQLKHVIQIFTMLTLRQHLYFALLLGLILRTLSAYFVFGPQALDDYLNNLLPAIQKFHNIQTVLPAYRSPLFPYIISSWIKLGQIIHIISIESSIVDIVRWVYFGLGAFSLLSIYALYIYFSNQQYINHAANQINLCTNNINLDTLPQKNQNYLPCCIGMYLIAASGIMPFISTRCLLESFSASFVLFGISLIHNAINHVLYSSDSPDNHEYGNRYYIIRSIIGFFTLGFACLIRFQVGILYVFILIWLLILLFYRLLKNNQHKNLSQKVTQQAANATNHIITLITIGSLVGFVVLLFQCLIEFATARPIFSILIEYFKANAHTANYGSSHWINTWILWLGFLGMPLSIGLFAHRSSLKILTQHKMIIACSLVFVFIHSIVSHKEERFLYPIIGFTMITLAIVWANSIQLKSKFEKYFFRPIFIFCNVIILAFTCLINTQMGEVGTLAFIQASSNNMLYIDRESLVGIGWMQQLFILPNSRSQIQRIDHQITKEELLNIIKKVNEDNLDGFTIITSKKDLRSEISNINTQLIHLKEFKQFFNSCSKEIEMSSLSDQLLFKLNPNGNMRRRPTWFIICMKN